MDSQGVTCNVIDPFGIQRICRARTEPFGNHSWDERSFANSAYVTTTVLSCLALVGLQEQGWDLHCG